VKVLHLSSGNMFGGVETCLITLAQYRHLCPEMEPHFGFCFQGKVSDSLEQEGVPVHFLGSTRFSRPWSVWQARRRLLQLLKQHQFDVVICHSCWPMALFGPAIKALRFPLVFWGHDTPSGTHWLEAQSTRILPDGIVANSKYTQSQIPILYPKPPVQVIYPPVADKHSIYTTEEITLKRTECHTPTDAVVIIQVSRLEPWKGQQLLLSALALLKDVPNWVCWIVGGAQRPQEEAYLANLRTQIDNSGIGNRVQFLGQRSDVPELLAAADIYCQPNMSPEPFGIAFIEALYANLPVITTAMGGPQEIITSDCGQLVPPENPEILAEALRVLIQSTEVRQRLGANGKRRAQELCEPQAQLRQLSEIFQQALESAS
jgi:glycosyltransferase involved in cell wall biosynthesis